MSVLSKIAKLGWSDERHYARKAKDYYDNNYIFGNPLFEGND